MKKAIILFVLSLAHFSQAQESLFFKANYSIGVPLAPSDYLKSASYSGFGLGFGKIFDSNFAISMEATWNHYVQYEPRKTYYFEGGAITTDLYKYRQHVPVVLAMNYFLFRECRLKLYTGLGLGVSYIEEKIYFNAYDIEEGSFGFLVQPKIGTCFAMDEYERFHIFAECGYNFSTNKSNDLQYNSISSLQIGIGGYFLINQ